MDKTYEVFKCNKYRRENNREETLYCPFVLFMTLVVLPKCNNPA